MLTDKLRVYFPDDSRVLMSDRIPLKSREVPYLFYDGKLYVDDRIKMYNNEIPWVALTDSFYRAQTRRAEYDIRYVPFFAFLSDRVPSRVEGTSFIPVDLSDVALKDYMETESQTFLTQTDWVNAKQYSDVYITSVSYRMYTLSTRMIDLLRFVDNIYVLKYVYRKGVDYQQLVELASIFSYQVTEEDLFIKITKTVDIPTYKSTFKEICNKVDIASYITNQVLGEYTLTQNSLLNFFQEEVLNND